MSLFTDRRPWQAAVRRAMALQPRIAYAAADDCIFPDVATRWQPHWSHRLGMLVTASQRLSARFVRSSALVLACLALVIGAIVVPDINAHPGIETVPQSHSTQPTGTMTLANAPASLRSTVERDLSPEFDAKYTSAGAQFNGSDFDLKVGRGLIGRTGSMQPIAAGSRSMAVGGFFGDHELTETFRSTASGIEQSFHVTARMPGAGPLMIEVPVSGLSATTTGGGVALHDHEQKIRAAYSGLRVMDASGTIVPSSMRAASHGHTIMIEVHDAAARYPVTVDPTWVQVTELTSTDGAAGDYVGTSVAISGNIAVVGAPSHTVSGHSDQGAAYVFTLSGGTWTEQQELASSDGAAGDAFGFSVALSGTTALVGAPNHTVNAYGLAGEAYVFAESGGSWTQTQDLTASDSYLNHQFGYSVAVSGSTAVIGAIDCCGDPKEIGPGEAYVFAESEGSWTQTQILTASDGVSPDEFGYSVAVSGSTAIVGAIETGDSLEGDGAAYVFTESGGSWTQTQELTASDAAAGDDFGYSVAMSGTTVVVGAIDNPYGLTDADGAAYVFAESGGTWSQTQELTPSDGVTHDEFGDSVALSGSTVIVGAIDHEVGTNTAQGSAYVFTYASSAWTQQQKLTSLDGAADDHFGNSVAVSGTTFVVGAPNHTVSGNADMGTAYVFTQGYLPTLAGSLATGHAQRHSTSTTCSKYPVDCATGDFFHTFTDTSVPGRGPALNLSRTYNSLNASAKGIFGYGWSSSYDQHLVVNGDGSVTVTEDDGSQVTAEPNGSGGYTVPSWADSTLTSSGGTYTFTRQASPIYTFNSSGQLTAISDPNGYSTTLSYTSGKLTTVTDPASRTITFSYGGNGLVSEVTNPDSHNTMYYYDGSDNLTSVTDPNSETTSFTYDGNHLLLTMTMPNGQSGGPDAGDDVVNTYYTGTGQVETQTDPAGLETQYSYTGNNFSDSGGTTTITDPHGNVEVEDYTDGELMSITKGYGTASAATWTYSYDPTSLGETEVTDPDTHSTIDSYDANGNLLSSEDANDKTTTYTYNSFNEPLTVTDPMGVETIYTYDTDGNVQTKEVKGIGGSPTETTYYTYGDGHNGDLTQVEDPDGHFTTYTYDSYGDVASTTTSAGSSGTSTTSAADKYAFTSIRAVGPFVGNYANGLSTLSVSPLAVGDALVLSVRISSSSITVSSVSSGGSTWTKLTNSADSSQSRDVELWLGTVTSTGTSTITVSYSGSVSSITTELNVQEYTYGTGSSTTWTKDVVGASQNDTSSTTVTFPSLTPTGTSELYVGFGRVANTPSAGSTTGFTYDISPAENPFIFDPNVSGAVSPTSSQSPSGASVTVGALIEASGSASSGSAAIAAVGPFVGNYANGLSTLSVSPLAVGDALVLSVRISSSSITVSSVSSGGSTWTKLTNSADSSQSRDVELWLGTVTSTGTSTITVSYSGSVSSITTELNVQEYTYGTGSSTTWTKDVVGASQNDTSSTTVTFPSLTPTGTSELYVGFGRVANTPSAGSTTGFTYDISPAENPFIFDPNVSGAVSPTSSQSPSGASVTVGALIEASSSSVSSGIAAVGSFTDNNGTGVTTLSVSPSTVGDALALSIKVSSSSISVSSISGGGVSSWSKLEGYTGYSGHDLELWMGKVTTTGSSTVTVTFSGSVSSTGVELVSQEFASGYGSATVWAKDTASGQSNSSSTTVSFPSLTPAGSGELYAGYASVSNTGEAGSTSGYTYDTTLDGNLFIFNPDVSSNSAPTGLVSPASTSGTVGALIEASEPTSVSPPTVTGVTPISGPASGGTSVAVTGTGFSGVTAVKFGLNAASSYTVNSATSITATSPSGSSGVVDVTVTAAGSATTSDSYNILGERYCEVSPNANAASVTCPAFGASRVADTSTWVYDADGNVLHAFDANGNETNYSYDADNNQTEVTDPLGNITKTVYDADDRTTSVTSGYSTGSATTTNYYFDITPGSCPSDPTGTTYCTQVKNGLTNITTSSYNSLDQMIEETAPNTTAQSPTTYTYDGVGNVKTEVDGSGTATYSYDNDNRVTGITYSSTGSGYSEPSNVTYTYDYDGNRTHMTDGSGTTTYAYDTLERLESVTNGADNVVTYGHDADGNITCMSYPNSGSTTCQTASSGTGLVSYAYNGAGEETSMTDWLGSGNVTSFGYDSDGNLTTITFPSGTTTSVTDTYDDADALTDTSYKIGTTTTNLAALGRNSDELIGSTTPPVGTATTYGYDPLNRVTTGTTASYTHDAASELTSVSPIGGSTTDFSYNADGQLCWTGASTGTCSSPPSGATTFSYSTAGERLSTTPSVSNPTTYGWDQAGNLVCETAPNASSYSCSNQHSTVTTTYAYNGDGLRISDTPAGGSAQQFTWDVSGSVPQLLEDGTSYYLYGPNTGSGPLEQISISGSTPTYLISDTTGVREQIGSTGSVVGSMSYDTYGNRCSTCSISTPFGFEGAYTDASGLIYLVHRYYDPVTSQFLSVDPLVDETGTPYAYTGGDPVNGSDANGLITCPKWLPGCGVVTDAQNAISGSVSGLWHAVESHASEISSVTGIAAIAVAEIPGVGEVAAPVLEATSLVTGAIATQSDLESHQYLQAALDSLGTLISAGGLAANVTSRLAMRAAVEAWDAGEAVIRLAGTAENAQRIEQLLDKVGAAVSALQLALPKSC